MRVEAHLKTINKNSKKYKNNDVVVRTLRILNGTENLLYASLPLDIKQNENTDVYIKVWYGEKMNQVNLKQ
jgi:hypothetical protein